MTKVCIILLVGLPGSGKTTFSKEITTALGTNESYNCYTISYDDIIGEGYRSKYKELRNKCLQYTEKIVTLLIEKDNFKNNLILIDDNMYYNSMRYEYYKLTRFHKISFLQVYFNLTMQEALIRNCNRSEEFRVPESVIQEMAGKIEIPNKKRHWEANSLTLNCTSTMNNEVYEHFLQVVDKIINTKQVQVVLPQEVNVSSSVLLKIDLTLRKIVSTKVKENVSMATLYNLKRKSIFQDIKDSHLVIDDEIGDGELLNYLEQQF